MHLFKLSEQSYFDLRGEPRVNDRFFSIFFFLLKLLEKYLKNIKKNIRKL